MPGRSVAIASQCRERYFDTETLLDVVGSLPSTVVSDLLDRFARELPLHVAAIEQAWAVADVPTLRRRVHTMRGTSLTFGCVGLSAICDAVQCCADSSDAAERSRAVSLLTAANAGALAELDALRAPEGLIGV